MFFGTQCRQPKNILITWCPRSSICVMDLPAMPILHFYTGMKWPACRGVRFGARMDSPARTACRLRRPVRPMLALDRQTSGQRDGQNDTSLQRSLRADARYIVSFICDHPIVGRITRYTPSVRPSVVCPSLLVVNSKKSTDDEQNEDMFTRFNRIHKRDRRTDGWHHWVGRV